MTCADEREEARARVIARLTNYSLGPCLECGGHGYKNMGKLACFWCRGAGVITQEMAHAFGVAERAEATTTQEPMNPENAGHDNGR